MIENLDLETLRKYRPTEIVEEVYRRIALHPLRPIWIELVPKEQALARAAALESSPDSMKLPLCGIPFAVKDNIDVAGMPTTAGCPAYAYTPEQSARVVELLLAAGAILIGKTNLDQFATGLVGVRSPYGICSSVYDERYISGGSSAGSAVAVAKGLVSFSLGTDTAGSGRVPAAFNNLIGTKPTRGAISNDGVVPACRTLDCVSIFAVNAEDALTVLKSAREPGTPDAAAPWAGGAFRFGVPPADQLEFFGDTAASELYTAAIARMEQQGGTRVEIDFRPFRAAADLLYSGPWVAERLTAIKPFFEAHADEMDPTVRTIIGGASKYSAVDTFDAMYKLEDFRKQTQTEWARMDVMLLPTTGTTYTIEEVLAQPVALNTNLGYYTNFVNLLDLAAAAIPAGFRPNGLPFGVTLIGPAFTDAALHHLASGIYPNTPPGCCLVAVLGAHLTGQPLNWQLTERGARLVKTCRTAPGYRFYALAGSVPPKPGLVRDDSVTGPGIEVEVWALPMEHFGSFVALIPPPLSIGSATLDDGSVVKCFLCEPYAISSAREITDLGGWRNYLTSLHGPSGEP
jgi:allophanate hydrolase